jgi:preprotein translocase subunit SecF
MGYCWKCGNKIEDDMTYCPKCGAALKAAPQRQGYGDDKVTRTFGLAVVGVLVAVAILIVALFAIGVLPGMQMPFGTMGSGHATTQPYNLSDFTAVSASQGFNVVITQGSSYSVKVTTDDNIQQYVDVHKSGSTLYLGLKTGFGISTTQLKAEVTMPNMTNLQLSGGSQASGQNLTLVTNLSIDFSGGSRATLTGQAVDLTVTGSGGSNINLQDFQVQNAKVDLSGGSQCKVNVSGKLDVNLSGGSQLQYRGTPTMGSQDISGGSRISPLT